MQRKILTTFAFLFAAWAGFTFGFIPLRGSSDEFWHLKTGRWICENRSLPANDIFTYTAEKIPWHNHEWLTQVCMWGIYHAGEEGGLGGWRAVIFAKTLLI